MVRYATTQAPFGRRKAPPTADLGWFEPSRDPERWTSGSRGRTTWWRRRRFSAHDAARLLRPGATISSETHPRVHGHHTVPFDSTSDRDSRLENSSPARTETPTRRFPSRPTADCWLAGGRRARVAATPTGRVGHLRTVRSTGNPWGRTLRTTSTERADPSDGWRARTVPQLEAITDPRPRLVDCGSATTPLHASDELGRHDSRRPARAPIESSGTALARDVHRPRRRLKTRPVPSRKRVAALASGDGPCQSGSPHCCWA